MQGIAVPTLRTGTMCTGGYRMPDELHFCRCREVGM